MVGKGNDEIHSEKFYVDKWKVTHKNKSDGGNYLVETFEGKVLVERVDQKKYLGQIISNKNNNMANICDIKIKSDIISKKIFNMLDTLRLGRYYFECGIIFLKSLLRSSIVYSAETYYNLTEAELRELEKIEENYLIQLYSTEKGCPRSQLYFESGLYSLRFEIMKIKVLFLHYILNQDSNSLISQFYTAQSEDPQRGDWVSQTNSICEYLDIDRGKLKIMTKEKLKSILNIKIRKKALEYLLKLRGSKGKEIIFTKLEMSDYLLPNDSKLSNVDKKYLYAIRNRMIKIQSNFYGQGEKESFCPSECGQYLNMNHIYVCQNLNKNTNISLPYEKIFNGKLREKIIVFNRMKQNIENMKWFENRQNS